MAGSQAIASGCRAGNVYATRLPTSQRELYPRPSRKQGRLRLARLGQQQQASVPQSRTDGPRGSYQRRLRVQRHSSAKRQHFPCCRIELRSRPNADSAPSLCEGDQHKPQCPKQAKDQPFEPVGAPCGPYPHAHADASYLQLPVIPFGFTVFVQQSSFTGLSCF